MNRPIFCLFASLVLMALAVPGSAQDIMWARIDTTMMMNGHFCYVLNYGTDSLNGTNWFSEENGYVRTIADWWTSEPDTLMFDTVTYYLVKQFPQVGDVWLSGGYEGPLRTEVVGTETLTVPAGTFFTYKVECWDTVSNVLIRLGNFADAVGYVYSIDYEDEFEMTLNDYDAEGGGCFPLTVGNWAEYLLDTIPPGVRPISETTISSDFVFTNAYPNPFNPTTVLSYELRVASPVRLEVFDILGNRVARLIDGRQTVGWHKVIFDGSTLTSGLYLYRMQAGEFQAAGKMVLMK